MRKVPVTILAIAAIVLAATWYISGLYYSERIATLGEQVKLRDDRINDFERRTSDMERQLAAKPLPPKVTEPTQSIKCEAWQRLVNEHLIRDLTEPERKAVAAALMSRETGAIEIAAVDEPMSQALAKTLAHLFEDAGWKVKRSTADPFIRGLFVVMTDTAMARKASAATAAVQDNTNHLFFNSSSGPGFPPLALVIGGDPIREESGWGTRLCDSLLHCSPASKNPTLDKAMRHVR